MEAHSVGTSSLNDPSGWALAEDELLVHTRSDTYRVDRKALWTISDLHQLLESKLSSNVHAFHIFDITGAPLLTDKDLYRALENRQTPFLATFDMGNAVVDCSELAQMQWKLMRDDIAAMLEKFGTCSRQVAQLQLQMDAVKGGQEDFEAVFRQHMEVIVDKMNDLQEHEDMPWTARAASDQHQREQREQHLNDSIGNSLKKQELGLRHKHWDLQTMIDQELQACQESQEKLDTKLQELQAQLDCEKLARDAWECKHNIDFKDKQATLLQYVQEDFQDLSTKCDQEVLARVNDIASQDAKLQELRKLLENEQQARHVWECRQSTEKQEVRGHLESIFQQYVHKDNQDVSELQDAMIAQDERVQEIRTQLDSEQQGMEAFQTRLAKEMDHLRETLETIFRQHVQVIVDKVTTLQDSADAVQSIEQFVRQSTNARLLDLEHRCSSMETRVMESINIKVDQQDKISAEFEKLKSEKIYDPCQAQDLFERVCHLEALFHQQLLNREKEKREKALKERERLAREEPAARDEQLRRLSQGLSNDQARQLADIQRKFAEYHDKDPIRHDMARSADVVEHPKLFDQKVVSAIVSEIVGELDKASEAYMQEVENAELGSKPPTRQAKSVSEMSTQGGSAPESSIASSRTSPLTNRSVAHGPLTAVSSGTTAYSPAVSSDAAAVRRESPRSSSRGRALPSPILVGGSPMPQPGGFSGGVQHSSSAVLYHLDGKALAQAPPPRSGSQSPSVVRVLSAGPYRVLSPRPYAGQRDRSETPNSPPRAAAATSRQRARAACSGGMTPPVVQNSTRTSWPSAATAESLSSGMTPPVVPNSSRTSATSAATTASLQKNCSRQVVAASVARQTSNEAPRHDRLSTSRRAMLSD